jgi:hypothetical protein
MPTEACRDHSERETLPGGPATIRAINAGSFADPEMTKARAGRAFDPGRAGETRMLGSDTNFPEIAAEVNAQNAPRRSFVEFDGRT